MHKYTYKIFIILNKSVIIIYMSGNFLIQGCMMKYFHKEIPLYDWVISKPIPY